MQKTFLSSVGAKTNRLVHKTKQQHSQKQALFFFLFSPIAPFHLIFLPFLAAESCQIQKWHQPAFSHPEHWVLLRFLPINSPPVQTRPRRGCQLLCSESFLSLVFHCCLKTNYFMFYQISVCLGEIYLLSSLFSKLAYLILFYF